MSKIQCHQMKSVKIPWDKQGVLQKKKTKKNKKTNLSTPIIQATILNYRKSSQESYINIISQAVGHIHYQFELI